MLLLSMVLVFKGIVQEQTGEAANSSSSILLPAGIRVMFL